MSDVPSGIKHEPASYPWACVKCGVIFMPKIITWPTGKRTTQKVCGCCVLKAIEAFCDEKDDLTQPPNVA